MSRCFIVIAAIQLAFVASAGAEPPAPSGWSVERRGTTAVYVPAGRRDVELRLYPAAGAGRALADWFASRLATAPASVDFAGYGESQELQDGSVRMAIGAGKVRGTPIAVVALACQKPDASKVYGELVVPQDEDVLRRYTSTAIELVVGGCFARGRTANAPASQGEDTDASADRAKPSNAPRSPEFRYLARDGRGLPRSSIEAVLYSWSQTYTVTGLSMDENAYLLLKDGRVRRLPPVPPDEFDAAAEQTAEPDRWGRWKKQGGDYLLKFAGDSSFSSPPGAIVGSPAPAGRKLSGTYSTSSSASFGTVSSWSTSYLNFSSDGRFSRSNMGGSGGTVGDTTSIARWDDDGSASSIGNESFAAGQHRKRPSNAADRQGTYRLDGYALELRYDSGRTERLFFFNVSSRSAWFGDGAYLRAGDKR